MSLMIRGMTMPKACVYRENGHLMTCPLYDIDGYCKALNTEARHKENEKLSCCPLVSVPKHGRLIDADALVKKQPIPELGAPRWLIEQAPTIIPAEPTQSNASNVLGALTNADRIRAMTDEELADFLNCHNFCARNFDCEKGKRPCKECNLDWLREEGE